MTSLFFAILDVAVGRHNLRSGPFGGSEGAIERTEEGVLREPVGGRGVT
jgi:hypothetical protein